MSKHVTTESAIVYRANGRRFFTKRSAYEAAARAKINEKCDCEPGDYNTPDSPCRYHEDGVQYSRIIKRLAKMYRAADTHSQKACDEAEAGGEAD